MGRATCLSTCVPAYLRTCIPVRALTLHSVRMTALLSTALSWTRPPAVVKQFTFVCLGGSGFGGRPEEGGGFKTEIGNLKLNYKNIF